MGEGLPRSRPIPDWLIDRGARQSMFDAFRAALACCHWRYLVGQGRAWESKGCKHLA